VVLRKTGLDYVEAASRTLAGYLRLGSTVMVKSTSYPGTTQEQVLGWLEEGSGQVAGTEFHIGYSPEGPCHGNGERTTTPTTRL
jgi:UDP-N-acetyl-D-glucosamine dehydrogenase